LTKLRWRIERDYQEPKREVGLGHFEGRGWRDFRHHATFRIAAYGFLVSEREAFPPSAPRSSSYFQALRLPGDCRPRDAPTWDPAPHPQLDRHTASTNSHRHRPSTIAMSMLRSILQIEAKGLKFVTQ
jgi:hypothetical protein